MDKFLFTDGTNGVREAQSQEELENWIASAERPEKTRIWLFASNEWISYAAYRNLLAIPIRKESPVSVQQVSVSGLKIKKKSSRSGLLKKFLYATGIAGAVFLVFNFTKLKWERADPLVSSATRPANVPLMDIDSLITDIENDRGQSLDRSTKTNLRLRNNWPEKILLLLNADKETSGNGSRFSNAEISIDNTTGFNLDKAIVKLSIWKDNKVEMSDTIQFSSIRYDKLSKRRLDYSYRGDSLSVSFESIRAKAFNFCYSASLKNNSGNYNDRWFCRE